jgi:DNA helicase-2/ATP-dependent DNA helicase PcrA
MTFTQGYKQLNDRQREAVDSLEGPVLVIAGPGTGKTQLISLRVANILRQSGGINPQNILCLTFTESGQAAMQQRLQQLIGSAADKVAVHTFHGFGTSIIQANADYFFDMAGFTPASELHTFEV